MEWVRFASGKYQKLDCARLTMSQGSSVLLRLALVGLSVFVLIPVFAADPEPSSPQQRCAEAEKEPAKPVFPKSAKGKEGWVVVTYDLDGSGRATKIAAQASEPSGVFDDAVVNAVGRAGFQEGVVRQGCRQVFRFWLNPPMMRAVVRPSEEYLNKLGEIFRRKISYKVSETNPAVEVVVRFGPDGKILGRTVTKSSDEPEWDAAVLQAIDKTDSLPLDALGYIPSQIAFVFRPQALH